MSRRLRARGLRWLTSRRGLPLLLEPRAGVQAADFHFGDCACRFLSSAAPRGRRAVSKRGRAERSRRRRPHSARRDDAGSGRAAWHAVQRRQGDRHRLRRADGFDPADASGRRDRMGDDAARRSECRLRRARRKISRWRQGVRSGAERSTRRRPPGSRKVFLFIHGFNTMFAEGLYRLAQLAHDSKAPGVPVLFTWASRGKPTAYVYDLNSATSARDGLEHTLRLLCRAMPKR